MTYTYCIDIFIPTIHNTNKKPSTFLLIIITRIETPHHIKFRKSLIEILARYSFFLRKKNIYRFIFIRKKIHFYIEILIRFVTLWRNSKKICYVSLELGVVEVSREERFGIVGGFSIHGYINRVLQWDKVDFFRTQGFIGERPF